MSTKIKTADYYFGVYQAEVLKWVSFFGLTQFRIDFELFEEGTSLARCGTIQESGLAMFGLNRTWDNSGHWVPELTRDNVKQTAFHEVCHLLISKLDYMATCRYIQPEEIQEENEKLVIILENTVYPHLKKIKKL